MWGSFGYIFYFCSTEYDIMGVSILERQRKVKKIGQEELSKHLGISRELLGKYENRKSTPRLELLECWCLYLGIELQLILKQ